jgi:hypothetical protein
MVDAQHRGSQPTKRRAKTMTTEDLGTNHSGNDSFDTLLEARSRAARCSRARSASRPPFFGSGARRLRLER